MPDPKDAKPLPLGLNGAHDSVIAHPISPEANLFATQRLPESTRIRLAREAFPQITEGFDVGLDCRGETAL